MARLARSVLLGYPHTVSQRGNHDQTVFEDDADYRRYLGWLRESAERYSLDIWAYCLMPNHGHFVCVPKTGDGLARTFNTLHMKYAQYFHKKKNLTGQLWRGRFLSCPLDDQSVYEEIRFIENNPVRAGIAERAEDYPWSSARSRVTGALNPVLSDCRCFLTTEIRDWHCYLTSGGDQAIISRARARLKTGRPAGDSEFVHRLEGIIGRRLEALPRGRPRKDRL